MWIDIERTRNRKDNTKNSYVLTLCQVLVSALYMRCFISLDNNMPATVPFLCPLTASLWSELILFPLSHFSFILPPIIIKLLSLPSTVKVTNHLHAGKSGRRITTCSSTLNLLATFGKADQALLESLKGWSSSGYFMFLIGFIRTQSYFVSLHTRM